MALFGSNDEDESECTAHHYGEYTLDHDSIHVRTHYRHLATLDLPAMEIQVPQVAQCQHHGCTSKHRKDYKQKKVLPLIDLGEDSEDAVAQLRKYADRIEERYLDDDDED